MFAGSSEAGYLDGPSTAARFLRPEGLALDQDGTLYVCDAQNNLIRIISSSRNVSTLAGSSTQTFANGIGTNAGFLRPKGIALSVIPKKIELGRANVSLLAGSAEADCRDGLGSNARFKRLLEMVVSLGGVIFIADQLNSAIRRIDRLGNTTTLAGRPTSGLLDGTGSHALFNDLVSDDSGNFYVSDLSNFNIRKITSFGQVTPFVGRINLSGKEGFVDGQGCFGVSLACSASKELKMY